MFTAHRAVSIGNYIGLGFGVEITAASHDLTSVSIMLPDAAIITLMIAVVV